MWGDVRLGGHRCVEIAYVIGHLPRACGHGEGRASPLVGVLAGIRELAGAETLFCRDGLALIQSVSLNGLSHRVGRIWEYSGRAC